MKVKRSVFENAMNILVGCNIDVTPIDGIFMMFAGVM